ncbi:hypothetical protein BEP19_05200 [Ammoniphilus oxalaticus]|uniref:DUF4330 domain-containing protein n=1 Tax=Ammoniphilus oxalaticus TaxID=66863 RepID=A0A419SIP0_9BACL|nr:DUF4330 domain-containing protein [Ammoniphilus oxalaticus]RKD23827.1 hypothetical protein BEP19_05200 [Ammoniphilus oxalaticus]
MKAIDERGRLFGLMNILDLFLIIILIGASVFAGLKFLKPGDIQIGTSSGQQEVSYTLFNSGEHPFVVDEIKEGDMIKLVDNNSTLGTVVAVEKKPAMNYVNTADGRTVLAPVPEKYEVYIHMKANARVSGDSAVVGDTGLLVGNRVKIKGPVYMMEALVRDVEIGDPS